MEPAPFSKPPPVSEPVTEPEPAPEPVAEPIPEVQPVATSPAPAAGAHTISVGAQGVTPPYIPVTPETKSGGKTGTLLIGIGVAILLLGLAVAALSVSGAEDLKPAHFQPLIIESIVWNGTGSVVNESLDLESGVSYQVRLEQGATIENLTIWSSEYSKDLFDAGECRDSSEEDAIDDCRDYTDYDIGYFEATSDSTISFNSTGEVVICDMEVLIEDVGAVIWEKQLGPWLGAFCVGGFSCCLSTILLIVGIIVRSN